MFFRSPTFVIALQPKPFETPYIDFYVQYIYIYIHLHLIIPLGHYRHKHIHIRTLTPYYASHIHKIEFMAG